MSFTSEASTIIPRNLPEVFDHLSTKGQFLALVKLSPSTYFIEIVRRDVVYLSPTNMSYTTTVSEGYEKCPRLHFKLVEQVKYLGFSIKVNILSTQVISQRKKLHIYESSANNGQVTIYKVRQFSEHETTQTRVHETIKGKTSWIMSGFVSRECRKAHAEHVSKYNQLL